MKFTFEMPWKGKHLILNAEMVYDSNQVERIRISHKDHFFIVQNNRPLLGPNAKKKIQWKLWEGKVTDQQFLTEVVYTLENYIKHYGDPPLVTRKPF